ncbi:MAG: beta-lactamase family protein [Chlorobia bacterium]|nr:beta-lactamase family protein [Fimbriimonadaceae bacterium]
MRNALLISSLFMASVSQADQVDEIVERAIKGQKIPGVAVMVLREGKPIKTKGYGFANLEHRVPVKPETIFQSGSVGKQFTSTLVMMLVEEGKMKLEDPISKHFPEAKGAWNGVRLRHLLSHTSGLPDMPYGKMDLRKDYTETDLVKFMVDQKPPEKPGEKWRYNNGGYVMLGILVKRVTGKFYGDMLQEKIFKPLGMNTARIINEADIIPNRAAGYELGKDGIKNQDWVAPMTNTTADGSLYLSLLDYAKWDAALYGTKLLKASSRELMWKSTVLNDGKSTPYGFGWGTQMVGGKRLIDHGGAWQGFTTYIGRHVDQKITVVVLTNLNAGRPELIGRSILQVYVPAKP